MENESHPAKAPQWLLKDLGITQRQWKSRKRKELKMIVDAYNVYVRGSCYCPAYGSELEVLEVALNMMKNSHSIKGWGR